MAERNDNTDTVQLIFIRSSDTAFHVHLQNNFFSVFGDFTKGHIKSEYSKMLLSSELKSSSASANEDNWIIKQAYQHCHGSLPENVNTINFLRKNANWILQHLNLWTRVLCHEPSRKLSSLPMLHSNTSLLRCAFLLQAWKQILKSYPGTKTLRNPAEACNDSKHPCSLNWSEYFFYNNMPEGSKCKNMS